MMTIIDDDDDDDVKRFDSKLLEIVLLTSKLFDSKKC